MGAGKDGRPVRDNYMKRNFSLEKLKNFSSVKNDLTVLRHMWFGSKKGDDHAARLESFYGPQAAACEFVQLFRTSLYVSFRLKSSACVACADDAFRSRFLWGRKPMLAACAARLAGASNMIWVDLGGGTGVSRGHVAATVQARWRHDD